MNKGVGNNYFCMEIIRQVFWESVKYNFELVAKHLPGVQNIIPDRLSRVHEKGSIFGDKLWLCCSPE